MNRSKYLTLALMITAVFAVSIQAQKRTTKRTTAPKTPPAAAAATAAASAEIRAGAEKAATQLNNVAVFNYRLGGIATGLEDMDAAARKTPLKEPTLSRHRSNKQAVVQGIRNLKAGLTELEIEFRAKTNLRKYSLQIGGIADLAGQSEELAAGGQFTAAGKVLLQVIQKLTDTLVAMP